MVWRKFGSSRLASHFLILLRQDPELRFSPPKQE